MITYEIEHLEVTPREHLSTHTGDIIITEWTMTATFHITGTTSAGEAMGTLEERLRGE